LIDCPTSAATKILPTPRRVNKTLQQRAGKTITVTLDMAFAIEVPGEANPLTPQQVYLALQSASSSQQLSIQTGTQQLQTWETQRGYYTLLQACFLPAIL
jgi:hypothetical protein